MWHVSSRSGESANCYTLLYFTLLYFYNTAAETSQSWWYDDGDDDNDGDDRDTIKTHLSIVICSAASQILWQSSYKWWQEAAYRRLVSRCCRNWPSWLHARTSRLGSQSMCMTRLIASKRIAFLALECCTFFDFGGSCALFSIVSMHSVSRFLTVGSSTEHGS